MDQYLRLERVGPEALHPVEDYADFTIFQTDAWLSFVEETQSGEPVFAKLVADNQVVGRFTGLLFRKSGLRLLGSPAPGWTTSYMGFNLDEGISRRAAVKALKRDAFSEFGCLHFELLDRRIGIEDARALGLRYQATSGFEIDLTQSEDQLFSGMLPACRRCIRKAEKSGVAIEQATDESFAHDYYQQLQDVFAKQGLAPTYSEARVKALVKHLLPTGNILLLRARNADGDCVATGIFPAANDFMFFWGGASLRTGQIDRPNEAVQWAAMRFWKAAGMRTYDMGGGGEYKRKYGGRDISGAWIRHSKYRILEPLRNSAQLAKRFQQRAGGFGKS
jgi:hypothetical protein